MEVAERTCRQAGQHYNKIMLVDFTVYGWICCPGCGDSLNPEMQEEGGHVCEPYRQAVWQESMLQAEINRFEQEFATWLATPHGRFASFLAAQR